MKNIKFLGLLSVAALALSVSSCTNDNEPVVSGNETENNTESGVFTIKANIGDLQQTRATVKPEDGKSFTWEENDVFDLYQSSDMTANTFTIDNNNISSDGKSADFNCSGFAPVDGEVFYAFYPQGFTTTDNEAFTYSIPDDVYTQTGDNNTDHLSKGMIMVATGKSADIQNSVTFEHKTALFRFGISNLKSEEVKVNSIKLSSTDLQCFAKKYTYNIKGTETIEGKSNTLELSFGEGISLASGNAIKAYTLAIPADAIAEGETEAFTLEVSYNEGSTIANKIILGSDKSFAVGNVYTFNIDIEDISRFYVTGTYNGWGWDDCQYVYNIGDNAYRGIIYMNDTGTESEYRWKVTEDTSWSMGVWPKDGNGKVTKRSCIFTLYTMDNTIKEQNIKDCNSWGVVGGFNNWGDDGQDIEMKYGFDGDHYLIADVVFGEGKDLTWKLRGDNNYDFQINSEDNSYIKIQGPVDGVKDGSKNFILTAGAGTYEFKWYFNLPQPKIVVTKKEP